MMHGSIYIRVTFNHIATSNSLQFSCYMFRPLSAIFKDYQSITGRSCKVQCCLYRETNFAFTNVDHCLHIYDVTFISLLALHFAFVCFMFYID